MKIIYLGNLKNLASIFDDIGYFKNKQFLHLDYIKKVKFDNDTIKIESMFCKSIGLLNQNSDSIIITLKTKLKAGFKFIGILIIIFFGCFIFADKVTINGEFDPPLLKRILFALAALVMFSIPAFLISKMPKYLDNRLKKIITNFKTPNNL